MMRDAIARSLRLRLLLGTSITSGAILALLGVSVYLFMWHRLLAEFDAALLTKAHTVAGMVELSDQAVGFDADFEQMPEFTRKKNPDYFEIYLSTGKVLARSPSLGNNDLPKSSDTSTSVRTILPDGHVGRSLTMTFPVHYEHDDSNPSRESHESATVVVASRPAEMNHTLEDLGWLLSILCATAVVISGISLYRIVGRAVSPVNDLATEIGSLRETDLSRRFDSQHIPAELAPVIEKLNDLLARLEESFCREKAFTADVAHELRTPLAGIKMTLDVCRSRPRESQAYESAIDECRAMTDRLQALIENLLMLARADAGQLPVRRQKADLYHLVQECWIPLLPRIEAKKLHVESNCTGDANVEIDPDKTRIILRNLLDNAVSHVNETGRIRWSIARVENRIQITVTNTGSQISPTETSRIFDRFWRGDQARTDTGTHCGLGLSLCQRLVALLNGQISVNSTVGGEFSVTVTFATDR